MALQVAVVAVVSMARLLSDDVMFMRMFRTVNSTDFIVEVQLCALIEDR